MDIAALDKSNDPWLHVCPGTVDALANSLGKWELGGSGKRISRIVRGRKCTTVADFFDEFAAALQFPPTFGENWDAFADCLHDCRRFPEKAAIAICITDADKLLATAPATAAGTLAEVLTECVHELNAPSKPSKRQPMHILFQCAPPKMAALVKRWQAVGLMLAGK